MKNVATKSSSGVRRGWQLPPTSSKPEGATESRGQTKVGFVQSRENRAKLLKKKKGCRKVMKVEREVRGLWGGWSKRTTLRLQQRNSGGSRKSRWSVHPLKVSEFTASFHAGELFISTSSASIVYVSLLSVDSNSPLFFFF